MLLREPFRNMKNDAIIWKKRRVRRPGLTQDAAALGVHRQTLWRIVNGVYENPTLLARYQQLKADQIEKSNQTFSNNTKTTQI